MWDKIKVEITSKFEWALKDIGIEKIISVPIRSLGQRVGDKFTKLSKIGFSIKCSAGHFLLFFLSKNVKFGFRVERCVLAIKSKHFRDFLEGAWQIVTQLVHPFSGDNNLAPFHLWGREIVLESEKVYKCFVQDCTRKTWFTDFSVKLKKRVLWSYFVSGKVKQELRVQIHELRVQIHELRVQIHKLQFKCTS